MSQQTDEHKYKPRPDLTRSIEVKDFLNYYWLKEELQDFCREYGISTQGGKIEISQRIERFLRTGSIALADRANSRLSPSMSKPRPTHIQSPQNKTLPEQYRGPLSPQTIIPPHFKCTQENRIFFESVIGPQFHFSVYMQDFFKQNIGKTYQDAIDAWYAEESRKKDKNYKKILHHNSSIIDLHETFLMIPRIKGKLTKMPSRPGKSSGADQVIINIRQMISMNSCSQILNSEHRSDGSNSQDHSY